MNRLGSVKFTHELLLAARILIVLLFLIFGWQKLTDYAGTLQYMRHTGVPIPPLAAIIAIVMEFFVSIALFVGVFTRPLAALLALYTLCTALIGHHFWTMSGMDEFENKINFFKNISIIGGLLLLYCAGPGDYSVDRFLQTKDARDSGSGI